MTVTASESETGTRSLGEAHAVVAALPTDSPERELAEFRRDELIFLRAIQLLRPLAVACDTTDAYIGVGATRRPNSTRPYLRWECCELHRGLKSAKANLNSRAEALGVERLSVSTPVVD